MMKLNVNTTHSLDLYDEATGDGAPFHAAIDSDSTVCIYFDTICEVDGKKCTRWLSREELIELRRLITKALSIIA